MDVRSAGPLEKVNLSAKFDLFHDRWSPKIVGAVNDCYVKLVKVQGEFVERSPRCIPLRFELSRPPFAERTPRPTAMSSSIPASSS